MYLWKIVSDNTLIKSGVKTLVFSPNTTELYSSEFIDLFLLLILLFFHLLIRGMCVTYEKKSDGGMCSVTLLQDDQYSLNAL